MASEIHLNDIGTIFEVTIKDGGVVVDISGATTKEIFLSPPSGTKKTKTATFKTNGTDGIIRYATVSGDLDEEGRWGIQGHIVLSSGDWSSDIVEFLVHRNL